MYSLFLDPYLLAAPPAGVNPSSIEEYIANLLLWRELLHERILPFYIPTASYDLLNECGCYPERYRLQVAIDQLELDDIQVHDVLTIFHSILFETSFIEETFGISNIIIDEVRYTPNEHIHDRPQPFLSEYERLLAMIGVLQVVPAEVSPNIILITKGLNKELEITNLECKSLCEWADSTSSHDLPAEIKAEIPSCNSPRGIYLAIDPVLLCGKSFTSTLFEFALKCELAKRSGSSYANQDATYAFGVQFFASCQKLGFLHEAYKIKMLLRTCADVALNENMQDTHALRESKGGDDKQRTRFQDKAWRRDIDHEYHLHYWQTSYGYEFACVVVHNNFSIY